MEDSNKDVVISIIAFLQLHCLDGLLLLEALISSQIIIGLLILDNILLIRMDQLEEMLLLRCLNLSVLPLEQVTLLPSIFHTTLILELDKLPH